METGMFDELLHEDVQYGEHRYSDVIQMRNRLLKVYSKNWQLVKGMPVPLRAGGSHSVF
jgi:hypothetical protein